MYNSDMSKCRKYKSNKIINIILKNHFEDFKISKLPRVRKEMREHTVNKVQKALNCGRKYSLEWADKQANNMLKIKHRHAVFTIPEFLIEEFRQDIIFGFGAVASLEDESMPELVCPN